MNTRRLGKIGEEIARAYLERQSLTFIAANVHCRFSELDLVMQDGPELVCVEVKYRSSAAFGSPEEGIHCSKLERLYAAAEWYVNRVQWKGPYRIDVLGITQYKGVTVVQHLKSVGE